MRAKGPNDPIAMKISTKTGDSGVTSLLYGKRVKKDRLRIEACGVLDELNSFLGLCRSRLKNKKWVSLITRIQRDLFLAGSETVCRGNDAFRLRKKIGHGEVRRLEKSIEELERRHKCGSFVLPGTNDISAHFDIARTVARRAERRVVALKNRGYVRNSHILVYLNRLSDLLFLLARSCEGRRI